MASRARTSSRPVVAVLCCGGSVMGRSGQFVSDRFLRPLADAGASVLLVPAMSGVVDAVAIASRCDALLMTGAVSNVSPTRYRQPCAGTDVDLERDEVAMSVASAMIEAGRPVLGICRGMQELNVLFGGSLATLDDDEALHMSGSWDCPRIFSHSHPVDIVGASFSRLARTADVASVHRQGVDRLGCGLTVEAIARDGLVEAFSARPRGAVVGVQWHPEFARSPLDVALFEQLATAAAA